ncbi:MAG: Hpt domain-containing protein [Victivallales bacterium]|nr:Hpt domain-containing protein [Victivallales bacterium]
MTIDDLISFGANTEEGLKRCLNNEGFYIRMVNKIPGDPNFQKLYDAMDAGDLAVAFDAAHAIKGAVTNLALTPIAKPVIELTEILRARQETDCTALLEAIRNARNELEALCAK